VVLPPGRRRRGHAPPLLSAPKAATSLPAISFVLERSRPERPTTTLHASSGRVDPVRLTLVAMNVGGQPLRLAPRDLLLRFCEWDVQGSHSSTGSTERKPRPAGADEYVALRTGARATLTSDQLFPGTLGARQIKVSGRGWYQLRAVCDRPAREPCPAPDCWAGKISSNIVWLRIK
jgi:hypothetical protein